MAEKIIELRGISKRYGYGEAASFALEDFDLDVRRGEFIMVMGPSGCGKTTLLNIIGLLDKATFGSYFLNGEPVERISARKKAKVRANKIGFVFQNFNLVPTLNVLDNVVLPLIYAGHRKTRREYEADDILERFHLKEREYYMPNQLSGGQQQRVAIARSLVAEPEIILADEPTGNLDSRSAHIVMEELKEIHEEGNTIIMVTHNPNLTTYATRVINMLDGRIDTDIKTVADGDLPQPVSVRIGKRKRGKEEKVQENSEDENAGEEIMVTETGRVVDGEKMEVEDLGKFDNLGDLGESKKAEELKESKSVDEPKESGEVKETEDSGEAKKKEKKKEKA